MKFSNSSIIYGFSVAVHAGLGLSVAAIPIRSVIESYQLTVSETTKEPAKKEAEPSLEPVKAEREEPRVRKAMAKPAAAPVPTAAAAADTPAAADAPDFGLSLSGGPGGPGGIAVPSGARPSAPATHAAAPVKKLLAAPVRANALDDCAEDLVKAKLLSIVQASYTQAARDAQIQGKVRVQIQLDEQGNVLGAKVLAGLGHGLDEAALAAARSAKFSPATRCGKPVSSTVTAGISFKF